MTTKIMGEKGSKRDSSFNIIEILKATDYTLDFHTIVRELYVESPLDKWSRNEIYRFTIGDDTVDFDTFVSANSEYLKTSDIAIKVSERDPIAFNMMIDTDLSLTINSIINELIASQATGNTSPRLVWLYHTLTNVSKRVVNNEVFGNRSEVVNFTSPREYLSHISPWINKAQGPKSLKQSFTDEYAYFQKRLDALDILFQTNKHPDNVMGRFVCSFLMYYITKLTKLRLDAVGNYVKVLRAVCLNKIR